MPDGRPAPPGPPSASAPRRGWRVHVVEVPAEELRFHRVSGRLCLDLVATIGERWRRRFERLRAPADLDRWLAGAGLAVPTAAAEEDLAAARRLRGAVERLAVAAMSGEPYPGSAVATVNRAAAMPGPTPALHGREAVEVVADHAAALSTVARDAIELFGGDLAARVRECAAPDCALLFVDRSRPGTRRWCSMRACGNRTKVAQHRRRSRPDPADRRGGTS